MISARVREALTRRPFIPFAVIMVDRKEYAVDHPEYAVLSPGGRELTVYESDEVRHTIDVLRIKRVQATS